jgi:hypothetical protein
MRSHLLHPNHFLNIANGISRDFERIRDREQGMKHRQLKDPIRNIPARTSEQVFKAPEMRVRHGVMRWCVVGVTHSGTC